MKRTRLKQATAMWLRPTRMFSLLILCTFAVGFPGCPRTPETSATWRQDGVAQVWMERDSEAFCYLTRISGSFRGDGEMIHLGLMNNPGGSVDWVLEGTSKAKSVTATAQCAFWTSFDLPSHQIVTPPWNYVSTTCKTSTVNVPVLCCRGGGVRAGDQTPGSSFQGPHQCPISETHQCGQVPTQVTTCTKDTPHSQLQISGSGFCYLTGIHGRFDGSGENAYLSVAGSDSTLTVTSLTPIGEGNVGATSACITYATAANADRQLSHEYRWEQGQSPVQMISENEGVCFLTGVGGSFQGDGEWVEIQRPDPSSTSGQLLTGSSKQQGVWASARCLKYSQG